MAAALVAAPAAPGFGHDDDRNHGHRTSAEDETDSFSCAEGAVVGNRGIGRPYARKAAPTAPAGEYPVSAERDDPPSDPVGEAAYRYKINPIRVKTGTNTRTGATR